MIQSVYEEDVTYLCKLLNMFNAWFTQNLVQPVIDYWAMNATSYFIENTKTLSCRTARHCGAISGYIQTLVNPVILFISRL